jgi:uncharacterized protein YraI
MKILIDHQLPFGANAGNKAVTSVSGIGQRAFSQVNVASYTGPGDAYGHFTADTGW